MSNSLRDFEQRLRDTGNNVTAVRIKVFQSLQGKEPQTMSEIIKKMPEIDRTSIYRSVALFERLQIIHRLNIGWKYKLELTDFFHYHHHHMTCKVCNKTQALDENNQLEKIIHELASTDGFVMQSHQIEIIGMCKMCQLK